MARSPNTEALQRYLRDALRVLKAASDLSGDINKALYWFRNHPLQPFEYKTAEHLVADGKGDAAVHLDARGWLCWIKLQRFAIEAYRMHTPKRAFDPKSGASVEPLAVPPRLADLSLRK